MWDGAQDGGGRAPACLAETREAGAEGRGETGGVGRGKWSGCPGKAFTFPSPVSFQVGQEEEEESDIFSIREVSFQAVGESEWKDTNYTLNTDSLDWVSVGRGVAQRGSPAPGRGAAWDQEGLSVLTGLVRPPDGFPG